MKGYILLQQYQEECLKNIISCIIIFKFRYEEREAVEPCVTDTTKQVTDTTEGEISRPASQIVPSYLF